MSKCATFNHASSWNQIKRTFRSSTLSLPRGGFQCLLGSDVSSGESTTFQTPSAAVHGKEVYMVIEMVSCHKLYYVSRPAHFLTARYLKFLNDFCWGWPHGYCHNQREQIQQHNILKRVKNRGPWPLSPLILELQSFTLRSTCGRTVLKLHFKVVMLGAASALHGCPTPKSTARTRLPAMRFKYHPD
jgi:hypothetical protein